MATKLARRSKARIQKMFNKGVTACLKQGRQSMCDGACRYRGDKGTKCFAGHLIRARHYKLQLEGSTVNDGANCTDVVAAIEKSQGFMLKKSDVDLIGQCQLIHDDRTIKSWPECFQAVATEYGLKMPTVKGKV